MAPPLPTSHAKGDLLAACVKCGVKWLHPVGMLGSIFKRRVRAYFKHRGRRYAFAVTDPFIEHAYLAQADGRYAVDQAFVCVSLAKVWDGFAYKLVAAIVTPERAP